MGKIISKPKDQQLQNSDGQEAPGQLSLIFTAISQKILLPHSVFNIALFVENSCQDQNQNQNQAGTKNEKGKKENSCALHFSAKITREKETFSTLKEISVSRGKSTTLSIKIPELKSPAESEYKLILSVRDQDEDGSANEERKRPKEKTFEGKIFTRKLLPPCELYSHTDKNCYKPGDTVKFRIVVLDPNFRPFSDSVSKVNVKILDADRNVVKIWTEASTHYGIFSAEFPLSTNPIFGGWEIQYEALVKTQSQNDQEKQMKNEKGTLHFKVAEYVTPKHKIRVTLPPYITFNDKKIRVRVEVKYFHGGGVRGQVKLTPSLNNTHPDADENVGVLQLGPEMAEPKEETLGKILPLDDSGIVETEMEYKTLFKKSTGIVDLTQVYVHVQFTEGVTGTGKKTTESSFVYLYKYPYTMHIWSSPRKLVKGLNYTLSIRLSMQDGAPITDQFRDVVQINHKFPIPAVEKPTTTEEMTQEHLIQIPSQNLDADGIFKMAFDANATSRVNSKECTKILVKFRELTETERIDHHDDSPYLMVIIKGKENGGNSQVDVAVVYKPPFQSLNYFITQSDMNKILGFGTKEFSSPKTLHEFTIPCPNEHSLSSLSSASDSEHQLTLFIFIFNLKLGETMQVETCDFAVKNTNVKTLSKNFLDISLSEETKPAGKVTLKIQTGKNSLVALKAVEESDFIVSNYSEVIYSAAIRYAKWKRWEKENQVPFESGLSPSISLMNDQDLRVITNGPLEEFVFVNNNDLTETCPTPPVRIQVPETWIWEESLSKNGTLSLSKTVPDLLTSWIITGFSISKELGIAAVSKPKQLITGGGSRIENRESRI